MGSGAPAAAHRCFWQTNDGRPVSTATGQYGPGMSSLAERLGHPADAKLLILSCTNLGTCHGANVGVYESLRSGLATSASLMVPAPWAREAVSGYRGATDIGVHLTLNSEFDCYRWGPITLAPSLRDGNGGYPATAADLWEHADLDEVRRECRSQIERAILWGFDITHLDSHLDALVPRPEFFDVYLEMAVDFNLPLRLDNPDAERNYGFAFRRLAEEEGAISPDRVVDLGQQRRRHALEKALFELEPGVTEIAFQPAIDTPEIRAISDDWAQRVDDYHALVHDAAVRDLVERTGATLISWADLRDLQRSS